MQLTPIPQADGRQFAAAEQRPLTWMLMSLGSCVGLSGAAEPLSRSHADFVRGRVCSKVGVGGVKLDPDSMCWLSVFGCWDCPLCIIRILSLRTYRSILLTTLTQLQL